MPSFDSIVEHAANRCGGLSSLEQEMPSLKTERQLQNLHDSECLSIMSLRIFRAGLKHSVVDAKWPVFEQVFNQFNPQTLAMLSDEDIEAFMQDKRLIRHFAKIKSIRANAIAIQELHQHHESVGSYLAAWPVTDIVGLWEDLKQRFTQLGGMSGPYFLRMVGKDTFLLTNDVIRALNHWGIVNGDVKNKKQKQAVQQIFTDWHIETNRPMSSLSMILALSI